MNLTSEYNAGVESGKAHNDNDPLCKENIRKMKECFADFQNESGFVLIYWKGYSDGLRLRK